MWMAVCLVGCVHMSAVSTTSIPADRRKPVEATGYRFLFLLINFDNNYVDELTQDLANQCKNGRVEGILTKQEDIMYFPLFAHAVQVSATGYCVVGTPPAPVHEQAAPEEPSQETSTEAADRELLKEAAARELLETP
jgi:hypothetical protein